MDLNGPFKPTIWGNRYGMTMSDLFGKWMVNAAIPDKSAETVANTLLNKWF